MKANSIVMFFSLLFIVNTVNAQDKKEVLQLQRNEEILNIMYFPTNGLLIKKGKNTMNSKSLDWELLHYNTDLSLRYKVAIEKTQINKGFRNYLVTSPDARFIYHIEPKGYNLTFGESSQFITAIDDKGKKKTYEMEELKDLGDRKAQFADSLFLYYISSITTKDPATKKKKDSTVLIKLSNKDFSRKDVTLNLPALRDEENSTDWYYCGNGENRIYMMSKTVKDDGTYMYDLLTLDGSGSIKKNISLDCKLDGVFIRPSNNVKYYHWADYENADFFTTTYTSMYTSTTNRMETHETVNPTMSAFGDMVIDEKNNSIYIYGLTGPVPFKRIGPLNKGYFVQKWDTDGNAIWKRQFDFSKEILDNSFVVIHATPFKRNLKFTILPDNSMRLQLLAKDMIYSFNLDAQGSMFSAYSNEFRNRNDASFSMAFDPKVGSSTMKYLISQDPKLTKSVQYNLYNFEKNDILLENDTKMDKVNLLLFYR